jgi:ABC-type glycerol-3-phosphate transport system permease component
MVYAIFWAFFASLNEHIPLMLEPLKLPEKLHFENYPNAMKALAVSGNSYLSMLWNTIWLTLANSFASLATVVVAAYALVRYQFRGRNIILTIMLLVMVLPSYGSGAATLRMYIRLGMYDSPLFIIKSFSALGSLTFITKTFFQNISPAYEEAARIDGANKMYIFTRVHIPMVAPSLLAVFILMFIGGWNDYATTIYYMPSYPTIASGLYIYESICKFNMDKPIYFAGVMMCAIPPMVLFAIFSDKLMTNVTMGGLK